MTGKDVTRMTISLLIATKWAGCITTELVGYNFEHWLVCWSFFEIICFLLVDKFFSWVYNDN